MNFIAFNQEEMASIELHTRELIAETRDVLTSNGSCDNIEHSLENIVQHYINGLHVQGYSGEMIVSVLASAFMTQLQLTHAAGHGMEALAERGGLGVPTAGQALLAVYTAADTGVDDQ